jgi:hypothetical protein
MSYFGRVRTWFRSSNSGFVACEDFINDCFLDGSTECEDRIEQGDYVFFQAMLAEDRATMIALRARLARPHEISAQLQLSSTYEDRRRAQILNFSSSTREDTKQFRSLTH